VHEGGLADGAEGAEEEVEGEEEGGKNLAALRVEAIDTLVEWDRFGLLAFFKGSFCTDFADYNRHAFNSGTLTGNI